MNKCPIVVAPGEAHIPLADYVADHSQREAGQILGCTQANVNLAIKAGREIYIVQKPDGSFDHYEIRRSRRKAS